MPKKLIIGLGFRARAGKDTIAEYLVREYGFKRYAFADKLREVCSILTGENAFAPDFKEYSTALGVSGGQLMQKVGNIMRQVNPNVWTRIVVDKIYESGHQNFVVPDVRYTTDAACIKELGGILVRIRRPGIALDNHVSELEGNYITWDYTLQNDGTLEQLHAQLNDLLEGLASRGLYTPAGASYTPEPPPAPSSAP